MRRRDFVAGIAGAVTSPTAALAQSGQVRRIGLLDPFEESDLFEKANVSAFKKGLSELGWTEGVNLRMDFRWLAGNIDRLDQYAKELVELQPQAILVNSTPQTAALQRKTQTIPIVFVIVSDPVGSRFVASLSRPGGNITGFMPWEPTMAGKWVQLLLEIAPSIKRIAAMFNPDTAPYVTSYYLPSFEAAARFFNIEPIPGPVRNGAEIETLIRSLDRDPTGGLVSMPDAFTTQHRVSITALATRYKVPAIHQLTEAVRDGALLSYGPSVPDIYYRAASYVDRILRGANPADLPVQLPVKYDTALNLKTAKALGLDVPAVTLLRADEVIE